MERRLSVTACIRCHCGHAKRWRGAVETRLRCKKKAIAEQCEARDRALREPRKSLPMVSCLMVSTVSSVPALSKSSMSIIIVQPMLHRLTAEAQTLQRGRTGHNEVGLGRRMARLSSTHFVATPSPKICCFFLHHIACQEPIGSTKTSVNCSGST